MSRQVLTTSARTSWIMRRRYDTSRARTSADRIEHARDDQCGRTDDRGHGERSAVRRWMAWKRSGFEFAKAHLSRGRFPFGIADEVRRSVADVERPELGVRCWDGRLQDWGAYAGDV
jgi:hypothetical protein